MSVSKPRTTTKIVSDGSVSFTTTPPVVPVVPVTRMNPSSYRELHEITEIPMTFHETSNPSNPSTDQKTTTTTTVGIAGSAKKGRKEEEQDESNACSFFGEDTGVLFQDEIRIYTKEDGEVKAHMSMIAIFDGHGDSGAVASREAASALVRWICYFAPRMVIMLLHRQEQEITTSIHGLFQFMDEATLEAVSSHSSSCGGATCSIVICLDIGYDIGYEKGNKEFMVTANVGDSPILMINHKTGKTSTVFGDHSWESPKERAHYLNHCMSKRLKPADAIYGRFNCDERKNFRDRDNKYRPLPIFLEGTNQIDPVNCEIVQRAALQRNAVGGVQSRRRMVMETQDPFTKVWKATAAIKGYEAVNWGSTGQGTTQFTRSLGDENVRNFMKIHTHCHPDICVMELSKNNEENDDITFVVGSDGGFDPYYYHEVADKIRSYPESATAQEMASMLCKETLKNIVGTYRTEQEHPVWDDVSFTVLRRRRI